MPVLYNISTLATCRPEGGQGAIHEISDAALVWQNDTIQWLGAAGDLPGAFAKEERHDAQGAYVIPGLIDCHTHLAFGGWRADEFALRCEGASYLDIARQGGGILSTVRHTRAAPEDTLFERCMGFLEAMIQLGVTTVECKSGYGLSVADELKTLRVYKHLQEEQPVRIVSTFLGAHMIPPEYKANRADYLHLLTHTLLPQIAQEHLASFCDIFVEKTAFTPDEARHLMHQAKTYGLRPKLHVDQLHDGGGAQLAAELSAISADHLEYAAPKGITAMAEANVVAVSLPLATLYLRQQPMPARAFIDAGVPVAVATDFNPGSAPSFHLPLAMTLACTMQRMTPAEVLKGTTYYAACAIDRQATIGSLEPGKRADFVLLDVPTLNHWLYHFQANATRATYLRGQRIWGPNTAT